MGAERHRRRVHPCRGRDEAARRVRHRAVREPTGRLARGGSDAEGSAAGGLRLVRDPLLRRRRRGEDHACVARPGHLRRLRPRAVQPERPPLPLPVHQLHELRPAFHYHREAALRSQEHVDEGLPHVRALRPRVRRPAGPPFPRAARRVLRMRPPYQLARARGHARSARRRSCPRRSRRRAGRP